MSQPTEESLSALIAPFLDQEGPLLPILHAIQEEYGHVPDGALTMIAAALNLTVAEVHGVMSFYHDFRKAPAGRHVVKICRAEACQSMGANAFSAEVLDKLGVGWGETRADGSVTVEAVYCLGLCACAPAAMVDGALVGRADATRVAAMVEGAA